MKYLHKICFNRFIFLSGKFYNLLFNYIQFFQEPVPILINCFYLSLITRIYAATRLCPIPKKDSFFYPPIVNRPKMLNQLQAIPFSFPSLPVAICLIRYTRHLLTDAHTSTSPTASH